MPDGSKDSEIHDALAGIQKQLKSIQKSMNSFESRIASLEQAVEQRISIDGENPLIYSRVLMTTLETIEEYEKEHGHGIVAKNLARARDIEQPTVYDHLSKLEGNNLIFWQRGTELGMKPYNAKFYSVVNRFESLADLPVMMSLPDEVVPVAQAILNASNEGVSRSGLLDILIKLKERGEKPWNKMTMKELEKSLKESIQTLLRRVLIRSKKTLDHDIYYPMN